LINNTHGLGARGAGRVWALEGQAIRAVGLQERALEAAYASAPAEWGEALSDPGLARYGIEFEDDTFAHVVRAFDRDNNGISVTEFLSTLRGHLNDRRRQLVQLAFRQLDKDGSGVCEFKEIAGIYDATRHPEVLAGRLTVEEVLLTFIKCWDRDGDGRITLLEFLDYYKDISCSIDDDDYFELMIRNAWHLAGGKGWCANTSNLRVLVVHNDGTEEVVGITNDLGLDKDDDAALRAALEDQGVSDIKKVELAF